MDEDVRKMSKEEADASVEDMGQFVDFMNEPCERCGIQNKDCECMGEIELERKLRLENP